MRFTVLPTRVDETVPKGRRPADVVREFAEAKARSAKDEVLQRAVILAADTIVELDGRALGKPVDAADARRILQGLAGRSHRVLTAVAVVDVAGRMASDVVESRVAFSPLTAAQIEVYVATGEPIDKAGAYGIQTLPPGWVRRIDGEYYNVVGLPLRATLRLLSEAGFVLPPHLRVS